MSARDAWLALHESIVRMIGLDSDTILLWHLSYPDIEAIRHIQEHAYVSYENKSELYRFSIAIFVGFDYSGTEPFPQFQQALGFAFDPRSVATMSTYSDGNIAHMCAVWVSKGYAKCVSKLISCGMLSSISERHMLNGSGQTPFIAGWNNTVNAGWNNAVRNGLYEDLQTYVRGWLKVLRLIGIDLTYYLRQENDCLSKMQQQELGKEYRWRRDHSRPYRFVQDNEAVAVDVEVVLSCTYTIWKRESPPGGWESPMPRYSFSPPGEGTWIPWTRVERLVESKPTRLSELVDAQKAESCLSDLHEDRTFESHDDARVVGLSICSDGSAKKAYYPRRRGRSQPPPFGRFYGNWTNGNHGVWQLHRCQGYLRLQLIWSQRDVQCCCNYLNPRMYEDTIFEIREQTEDFRRRYGLSKLGELPPEAYSYHRTGYERQYSDKQD